LQQPLILDERLTTPHLQPDRRPPRSANEPVALTPPMMDAVYLAHAFAEADRPVLLYGETGSGKTHFGEYIHRLSGRAGGFHPFSMGTEPPQLVADKLFGHIEGAFTGARRLRAGLIATAGTGTLLLDDFQTLELSVQKQVYQVLDRKVYFAVGSDRPVSMVCRVILAMTEDPDMLMSKGLLEPDLRYRFAMNDIRIPPLRERRPEIPYLARQALDACPTNVAPGGPTKFHRAALALLCEADYRGNVRQLIGVVERAYLLARAAGRDVIRPEDLKVDLPSLKYRQHGDREENRWVVERMLALTGGNVKAAAERLGVNRKTISAVRNSEVRRKGDSGSQ